MKKIDTLTISLPKGILSRLGSRLNKNMLWVVLASLTMLSVFFFMVYLDNGLGLSYNDARSHLDIGRRVVEGLKPGLAQLGSVWLPLPHLLTVPTIWNDFMWHSGLAGALQSMISFVATGVIIYLFLQKLGVGLLGRIIGVLVFAVNVNILYLQSTAMTELLLMATMTTGIYELMLWFKEDKSLSLIKSSFWIMLSTLIRYDGWFLFFMVGSLVALKTFKKKGYKASEGTFIFFCVLGGIGIVMWFLWNLLIFKDPLYFIFGPYSARAQQTQLEEAGILSTKGNWLLSLKVYFYALMFNSYVYNVVIGMIGAVMIWFDKNIKTLVKVATLPLFAPFIFNVLALYLGHSVLFVQGISGNTWFNVRYGLMMLPSIAIFAGYLVHRLNYLKYVVIGLFVFTTYFSFVNIDAVTLDDARVGSSQKNVSEVSGWLSENTKDKEGFILISAASHDAIIFSSGLPMKRFIHEGTGMYWESATTSPDRWARWIIMRTHDMNDQTFAAVSKTDALYKYDRVGEYPFADIYELKPEYLDQLNTKAVFTDQK